MQFGLDASEKKIEATPGATATCPNCGETVIAKCGKIIVWHWAHQARPDCDQWFEPETYWHRSWKSLYGKTEVVITKGAESHRADAITKYGVVVELQHSSISPIEIREREKFYGQMVWVFDVGDAYSDDRLILADKDSYITFRWKHPLKSLISAKKAVYLDLDGYWLLELRKMYGESPCGGWGLPVSRQEFLERYEG